MNLKTNFLLVFLIWTVHSQVEIENKSHPVSLLELKNIVIDGYQGTIDAQMLKLLGNVEFLAFWNCTDTLFNVNFLNPLKKVSGLSMIDSVIPMKWIILKKLAAMKHLEALELLRMNIPVLGANSLAGSNLKKLEIIHSNMATMKVGSLNGMDKLEVLNLRDNKLKVVPTASLAAVKSLKELNLQGNLLEKVTIEDIPYLPNLEKLSLGHNPIEQIDLKGLKEKLPNIEEIDVSGIDIHFYNPDGITFLHSAEVCC